MIREINYIPQIAQALKAGHAAIMVGSGFSRYADKCNGMDCDFLRWDQRIDCFYEKLYGNEGDSDFQTARRDAWKNFWIRLYNSPAEKIDNIRYADCQGRCQ